MLALKFKLSIRIMPTYEVDVIVYNSKSEQDEANSIYVQRSVMLTPGDSSPSAIIKIGDDLSSCFKQACFSDLTFLSQLSKPDMQQAIVISGFKVPLRIHEIFFIAESRLKVLQADSADTEKNSISDSLLIKIRQTSNPIIYKLSYNTDTDEISLVKATAVRVERSQQNRIK